MELLDGIKRESRRDKYLFCVALQPIFDPLDILNFTIRIIIWTRSMDDVVKGGVSSLNTTENILRGITPLRNPAAILRGELR